MKKDKNVLYIVDDSNEIHIESETFVIKDKESNKIYQIPIIKVDCIILHGYVKISNKVIYKCADNGIELVFLNHYGEFKARILGKYIESNVELRLLQFEVNRDIQKKLKLAKFIIIGKIQNQIAVLERALRTYEYDLEITGSMYRDIGMLEMYMVNIQLAQSLDSIRGIEGKSSSLYFGNIDNLIVKQKEKFTFEKRSRNPPLNEVNSMLSYLYVILASEVASALYTVGLDPYVGVLHTIRSGRESLALDLMEELRPFMVDRLVISLINKNQIHKDYFNKQDNGGIYLNNIGKKVVLTEWEKRKRVGIKHPYLGDTTHGMIPYCQATMLARYIRGDMEEYIPYKWR